MVQGSTHRNPSKSKGPTETHHYGSVNCSVFFTCGTHLEVETCTESSDLIVRMDTPTAGFSSTVPLPKTPIDEPFNEDYKKSFKCIISLLATA